MSVFDGTKKMSLVNFTDGTSNTAIIFEAKDPVMWTKPEDLVLPKAGDKMPELGGMFQTGMNLAMGDGSTPGSARTSTRRRCGRSSRHRAARSSISTSSARRRKWRK